MPLCLQASSLIAKSATAAPNNRVAVGTDEGGITSPVVYPKAMIVDAVTADIGQCLFVAMTGSEYMQTQAAVQYFSTCQASGGCSGGNTGNSGSVLDTFTATDGAMLSGAVIACWCTAFGIRAIIDVIRGSTNETQ